MRERWKNLLDEWAETNDVPKEPTEPTNGQDPVPIPESGTERPDSGLPEEDLHEIQEIQEEVSLLSTQTIENPVELSMSEDFRQKLQQIVPDLISTVVNRHTLDSLFEGVDRDSPQARKVVERKIRDVIREETFSFRAKKTDFLVQMVTNEIIAFGPITPLLQDDSINEIMVNDYREIYVEKDDELQRSHVSFIDQKQVYRTIEKILRPTNRSIDVMSPRVDARLPDGSRVHAIIPPVSADSPAITVRKFNRDRVHFEDLLEFDSLSEEMAFFLGACIKARLNIVVSGGTSSGKTTLLNAFSTLIPKSERIVTIEDSLELKLKSHHPHVVRLETREPNSEGRGEVSMRQLVRDALRMRPDRIIVGEVRGREVMDMLQAMNTGHDGSFTTVHANNPRETVSRLENLALMSGVEIPSRTVRNQISTSIDLFVQANRYQDNSRKISHITEVQHSDENQVELNDIFRFDHQGIDETGSVQGEFNRVQRSPTIRERFHREGLEFPDERFE